MGGLNKAVRRLGVNKTKLSWLKLTGAVGRCPVLLQWKENLQPTCKGAPTMSCTVGHHDCDSGPPCSDVEYVKRL